MISTRRAAAVIVVLLLAAVPTVVHTYMHWTVDDGWRASHVPEVLSGLTSRAAAAQCDLGTAALLDR